MYNFTIQKILLIGNNICKCDIFSKNLLSNVLKVSNNYLFIFFDIKVNFLLYFEYLYLLNKKLLGWPLSYIFKNEFFFKINIFLDIGVLVPRYETYIFINKLLNIIRYYNFSYILEYGFGSGIISLFLGTCKCLSLYGVDNDLNSFFIAVKNLYNLKIINNVYYYNNWTVFYCYNKNFNIIISNPPYVNFFSFVVLNNNLIPFESKKSLLTNYNGMHDIIFIAKISYIILQKNGFLIIEHGYRHSFLIRKIFFYFGYLSVNTYIDQCFVDRITIGKKC